MSGCSRPIKAIGVPRTVVVTLPAEIDVGNSGLVQAALAGALASTPNVVVADGTATGFCDCSAIAALMAIHRQAASTGVTLRVVVTTAAVRRVLEILEADQVLQVYPSLDAAQANGSHAPAS
jgi:anti-anti-sigma factor